MDSTEAATTTINPASIAAVLKRGKGDPLIGRRRTRVHRSNSLSGGRRAYMNLQATIGVALREHERIGHDCDMQSMGVPEYYQMDPREAGQYLTGERW